MGTPGLPDDGQDEMVEELEEVVDEAVDLKVKLDLIEEAELVVELKEAVSDQSRTASVIKRLCAWPMLCTDGDGSEVSIGTGILLASS